MAIETGTTNHRPDHRRLRRRHRTRLPAGSVPDVQQSGRWRPGRRPRRPGTAVGLLRGSVVHRPVPPPHRHRRLAPRRGPYGSIDELLSVCRKKEKRFIDCCRVPSFNSPMKKFNKRIVEATGTNSPTLYPKRALGDITIFHFECHF